MFSKFDEKEFDTKVYIISNVKLKQVICNIAQNTLLQFTRLIYYRNAVTELLSTSFPQNKLEELINKHETSCYEKEKGHFRSLYSKSFERKRENYRNIPYSLLSFFFEYKNLSSKGYTAKYMY